jgi:hypothetical protein
VGEKDMRLLPLLIFTAFLLLLVFTTTDGKEPRRAIMVSAPRLDTSIIAPKCPVRAMVLPQLDGTEWTFLIPSPVNCRET